MAKLYIERGFGAVPIELLNSKEISLKAKGLYAFLQSKPDGWRFSVERIASQLKEGRDAVRRALKELEKFGYLIRKPRYDKESKKLKGYDYILSEKQVYGKPGHLENWPTGLPLNISKKEYSKKDNSKKENIIDVRRKSEKQIETEFVNLYEKYSKEQMEKARKTLEKLYPKASQVLKEKMKK